ncbi:hypothetical protein [Rhodoplanes roseus]|uniref:hypothetical protein n=1 Tax=Rhodoplanes roseus TaxID=29409 RepID=UPI0014730C7D|nr:hypothetical protein [Rhodoplanes roseus]
MLVVVDQGLVSAGNFALTASVARLLPLSDFGRYMLIMTVVWLFTDLQVATVTGPYTINRPKLTAARRGPFFGSIVLHQGVVLMAAMLAAAMTAGTQSGAPGGSAITVVAAAALSVVGLLIRDQMRRLFIVHQQLVDCLKYDGVVLALHGTAVLAGVASGHFSLVWAYGSAAFACAIPSLHWLRRLGPVHRRPTLAWRHWKLNWGVGKWMVLSGVMWSLATYLYPWTITAAHGTTETGLWAAALGLSSLCNVPLGGLQNHYAVRIAAASTADLGGEVLGSAVRLAGLAFCFVVLFALVGGQLMGLLYGDRFVPAAPLTTLMAMNLLVGSVSFCVSRGLFAIGRGGADCTVNTVPLMVFVVCGAWATVSFGPLGAVASFLASNVVALAFRAAVLRRALAHRPVVTSVRSP